jgi:GDPmannose 4,6-dehydratase
LLEDYVITSEKYKRPNEVHDLLGDSSKANNYLNWHPKTSFKELVQIMVEEDVKNAEKEKMLIQNNLLDPTWEYSK